MIKDKILFGFIVILLLVTGGASYYRFAVTQDYLVAYEGDCDPVTEVCYVDCEDEECTSEYYYTVIERYAYEIFEKCGSDVSECDEAYECQLDVEYCEIYYCDPVEDGEEWCEDINSEDEL